MELFVQLRGFDFISLTNPGYVMLICIAAGALSTIGYTIIAPKIENPIKGTDTCGVHSLHGLPGVFGGITGIILVLPKLKYWALLLQY